MITLLLFPLHQHHCHSIICNVYHRVVSIRLQVYNMILYHYCYITRGMRSGTVPHTLVVGLGAACEIAGEDMEVRSGLAYRKSIHHTTVIPTLH